MFMIAGFPERISNENVVSLLSFTNLMVFLTDGSASKIGVSAETLISIELSDTKTTLK
ncbi:hypothetical protein D3C87_2192610 [compost metagenome]